MGEMTVLEPKTSPQASQKPKHRRFQPDDILNMVRLIAKGCNETEGCNLLGFHYDSWLNWKNKPKNKSFFDGALHEIKGQIIVNCIDGIEKAGLRDWRALRERLALLDQRFNDRAQAAPATQLSIYANVMVDATLTKVYAEPLPQQQVVDASEVKALPPASNDKA